MDQNQAAMVPALLSQVKRLENENRSLRKVRDTQKEELTQLNSVVWPTTVDMDDLESYKRGGAITPEAALALTLGNLRAQVEDLEDERESFIRTIVGLEDKIEELMSVDMARICKIRALEALVSSLQNETDCNKNYYSEVATSRTPKTDYIEDDDRSLSTFATSVSFYEESGHNRKVELVFPDEQLEV